jgi:hypothetical protein
VGAERLLFGSDAGFGTISLIQYRVAKYRAALGDEVYEDVVANSPRRLQQACL